MAAYAALVSLMHIIHDLDRYPSPPISLDKHIVDSITQYVTYFQEFLESYNPPPGAHHGDEEEAAADPLEMRIADAAYSAEDAIESHIVDSIQQQSNYDHVSKITRLMNFFRAPKKPKDANVEKIKSINLCRDSLQRVIGEMNSIEKVVAVKVDAEKKKMALLVHDQVAIQNVPAFVARSSTMVGSDGALQEIIEMLIGGSPDRRVIPIVGMGGIGKTFLAKCIYTKPIIKQHFDKCAWATISQEYNTREILCEVLSQATNTGKEQLSGKSEDVLGLELHKYLFNKRFLIVMDDIWSIDAWDRIQCYFPNKENGSRVLMTTRLFQLCSQLNSNYSLPMSFLDEASSWDLFSRTVFGEKSCPPVLKKIAEKIVANCRGLPLSIVVVGGLLRKMDHTQGSWESIKDNLTSVVNMENDQHCLRLLRLSYNHLPIYLKPCFLYMGVFEEDDEIIVSTIVKLWVSEGFLEPRNDKSLETTARALLQDLVDRNLILIEELGSTGSIKSCKIHDLLRDVCLKEGHKYGFYHVIGKCDPPSQGMNTQRRIVIPRNTSKKKVRGHLRSMSNARSIISEHGKVPPRWNLGLLRTLHTYKYRFYGDKTYYNSLGFRYVNLRHLAIEARGISSFLPSVSLFWNLHTLIVSCPYKLTLLADIWKMPQFRHIEFVHNCLSLPDPPSVVRDDDVIIMENLHTLKGVVNFKCSEAVVKRIPNIKKLLLRYDGLLGTDNKDEHYIGNIKSLCGLESFFVSLYMVRESNIYMQKLTFPNSLKKLHLGMDFGFKWDDMLEKIGLLPLLETLKLSVGCFGKGRWEIVEGQFPSLKYLGLYSCIGLEHWTTAEEGSNILPRLEQLELSDLPSLEEIPCELGNISTLKRIVMNDCGEGAVKSAKEIVDEQVESQGEELSLHALVTVEGKHKHLKRLSGPNFEVRDPISFHPLNNFLFTTYKAWWRSNLEKYQSNLETNQH